MPQPKIGRKTARGIVLKNGKVLLVERWRTGESGQNLHYFSVPGGGIESGESPETAVERELFEETNQRVKAVKLLATQKFSDGSSHLYFLCDHISGTRVLRPHTSATETQTKDNRSAPLWMSGDELKGLNLDELYQPVHGLITDVLNGKIPSLPLSIK